MSAMRQLTIAWLFCIAILGNLEAQQPVHDVRDVEVKVLLLDIQEIDSVSQNFTASLVIVLRWRDSGLAHNGPDPISLPLDDIWFPNIQILNQQKLVSTLPRAVEIHSDGEVVYRQRVWGSFSQPLHLQEFPFDAQRLQVILAKVSLSTESVNLIASPTSGISKSLTMPDWEVTGWDFVASNHSIDDESPPVQGMTLSLDVKRDTSFFIYKVILPLILIVMMSWLVFWIDPSMAASQISVSVTAMLTMIAYRFALAGMMPRLAFLTILDHFVLVSTLVVFLSMIEVVYTAHLSANNQLEKARNVDRKARWIVPLIYIVLTAQTFYLRAWL
jgi:hypothetical protein